MASFVLPSASLAKPNNLLNQHHHCFPQSSNLISFRLPSRSHSILQSTTQEAQSNRNQSTLVKARLNEVTGNGSSHAPATPEPKSAGPKEAKKDVQQADKLPQAISGSDASISEFMAQVSSLVKLVDSRDIVELQLKQSDCELVIRKKEALPQPTPSHVVAMHSPPPPAFTPSAFPPPPPTSPPALPPASSSPKSSAPSPPSGKPKSSQPPLKCPMAGTFYRCPAPGEPPFVKVGDKVKKGQTVCIIEAMKLMNEIEADRTGTIVEVLVDDGKPVSADMPLFTIEP